MPVGQALSALADLPGEAWTALSAVVAAVVGGVTAVLLERIRANRRLDAAADRVGAQIEVVRKLAAPTGNGFADEVNSKLDAALGTLTDLSQQVARMDTRLWNHIEQHNHPRKPR